MKKTQISSLLKQVSRTGFYGLLCATVAFYSLLSFIRPQSAGAAQLTSRKVTISSSKASQTAVQYDFTFSWGTATDVEGVIFQFCTTPLGTCTKPTGMDVSNDLVTLDSHTGFPTNTTAFAEQATSLGDCNDTGSAATVTMYCINRTEATSATGSGATVDLGAIINPSLSGSFTTVYVRVSLYDNNGFSNSGGAGNTRVHEGTVAAGITQQLTVNGRVQERLEFCVAAIDDDDSLPANCSAMPTTTTIDIGTIDNSLVAVSPVEPTTTNGSNDDYGVAMLNTNASNGAVITYFPEQASSGSNQLRGFRVSGATCNASSATLTDQCFRPAATSGTDLSAADGERFGLHIPCIDTTQGTTTNLGSVPDAYNNADNSTASATNCESFDGTGGGTPDTGDTFAWDDTGTAVTLASSSTVVDDEIVKLRFGSIASATTPTGAYTVVTEFIATPTF